MSQPDPSLTNIEQLSPEQASALVERKAQEHFGFGADEFARRWHTGEIDPDEDPHAMQVAMLLPLARP